MAERIVVGVDGSGGGRLALRWAREQARARSATLEVIHCWSHPPTVPLPGVPVTDPAEMNEIARRTLDEVLRGEGLVADGTTANAILVEGSPGPVLTEAARGAALLVVGSRGRGGFAGLLLGSVSQYCVHHAPCPVVVVRPSDVARMPT